MALQVVRCVGLRGPTTRLPRCRPSRPGRTTHPPVVVDRLLEGLEQRQRAVIGEGEDLREVHPAQAVDGVDPVVRVGQARPHQATGGAAGGRRLVVDLEGQAPALGHAGEELRVIGQRDGGLQVGDAAVAHVVQAQGDHGLGLEHPLAAELAAVEDHARELQVVAYGAVQAAAAHLELRLLRDLEGEGRERAVRPAQVGACEARAHVVADAKGGAAHAQRFEQVGLEEGAQRLAADGFHHLAGPVDVDAVLPALAGVEQQRQRQRLVLAGGDPGNVQGGLDLLDVGVPDLVAEAGAVGEQMAQGHRALGRAQCRLAIGVEAGEHPRVADLGHHLGRRCIQIQLPPLHALHGRHRGQRLGHGGDPAYRVQRHRLAAAERALAEGTLIDHAIAVGGHRHHARHGAGLHA